jgi:hypothetical protein
MFPMGVLTTMPAGDDVVMGETIVAGPNGVANTTAAPAMTTFGLNITSGWRNPQRNEAIGSVVPNSRHQYGDAIDLTFSSLPAGLTMAECNCILETAAEAVVGANNALAEQSSTPRPCDNALVNHIHAER